MKDDPAVQQGIRDPLISQTHCQCLSPRSQVLVSQSMRCIGSMLLSKIHQPDTKIQRAFIKILDRASKLTIFTVRYRDKQLESGMTCEGKGGWLDQSVRSTDRQWHSGQSEPSAHRETVAAAISREV